MWFEPISLLPGQRLISERGQNLSTESVAHASDSSWPDALYEHNITGETLLKSEFLRLPLFQRAYYRKIPYAIKVNQRGDAVERIFRDPGRPKQPRFVNSLGEEVPTDRPDDWIDFIAVHNQTEDEITREEFLALPPAEQQNYHKVPFCIMMTVDGYSGERIYRDANSSAAANSEE